MTAVAETVITAPGVYPDLPHEVYVADPVPGGSLSSSGAKRLLPPGCPALYRYWADHPEPPRDELDIGTAAHRMVLGVGPEIAPIDFPDWRSKAAQVARAEARAIGAVPLLGKDYDRVHQMAAALRQHPVAAALFDPETGQAEQSLFWRDQRAGVMRRARLDWLPANGSGRLLVGDFKTTVCAEPGEFERSAYRYGYFGQAAWYLDAVTALGLAGDDAPQFVWVAQEKEPPYLVSITYADAIALRWAADRNRQALDVYAECQAAGEWPGYGSELTPLALPAWVERHYLEETL